MFILGGLKGLNSPPNFRVSELAEVGILLGGRVSQQVLRHYEGARYQRSWK